MYDFLSLNNCEKIASILGNFGIFCITFYAFWLTYFSKNIKVTSTGKSHSRYFGSSINCTIVNKTLSPLLINEIRVVYDNKYEIPVKKVENEPLLIEGFRSQNIIGDKYSKLSEDIDYGTDVYFKIMTPEKTLNIKFRGKIKKKAKLETIGTFTYRYDDVVLTDLVRYVLTYWRKGERECKNIYITKDGMMNECLKDFNKLPVDVLNNPDKMVQIFKEIFNDENWCFQINEIGQR